VGVALAAFVAVRAVLLGAAADLFAAVAARRVRVLVAGSAGAGVVALAGRRPVRVGRGARFAAARGPDAGCGVAATWTVPAGAAGAAVIGVGVAGAMA